MTNQNYTINEAGLHYISLGLSAIRAKRNKQPMGFWKGYQASPPDKPYWEGQPAEAVAIVCGSVSGNLLCLDFDQHGKCFPDFIASLPPELREKIVCQRTQSGGYHVLFRCEAPVGGNVKLKSDSNGVLVETRGEGGYFLCAPTPSYEWTNGTLDSLQMLTIEEKTTIIECAQSFGKQTKENTAVSTLSHDKQADGTRPGDVLNEHGVDLIRRVLEKNGWSYVRDRSPDEELWLRPGETDQESSAILHTDKSLFHNFSTSAAPLENKSYSYFSIYALLEHGGDFSAAAKELAQLGYEAPIQDYSVEWEEIATESSDDENNSNVESVRNKSVLPKQGKTGKSSKNRKRPKLIRVSDVTEKAIQWLWGNKLPLGMLSLVTGLAGIGKSFLTVYMTAIITSGSNWPDGSPCEEGSVLFFYGEEGIEDTYIKRFRANGADQTKIVFMDGAESIDENREHSEIDVTLAMVDVIEEAIRKTAEQTGFPVKMVVIDPIANYWGDIRENSNAEVRSVLKPLQHLAEKTKVAFVMIQHEGKGEKEHAQQRVLGSTGIVATCRAVWGVFIDPNDKDKRIFAPVKVNCGYDHTAVSYRITPPDGTVEIAEASIENLTADDIAKMQRQVNVNKRGPKTDKVSDCMKQMEELLKDGDKAAKEIEKILLSNRFGMSTIQDAKRKLGAKSVRNGSEWHWRLPSALENDDVD